MGTRARPRERPRPLQVAAAALVLSMAALSVLLLRSGRTVLDSARERLALAAAFDTSGGRARGLAGAAGEFQSEARTPRIRRALRILEENGALIRKEYGECAADAGKACGSAHALAMCFASVACCRRHAAA